MAREDSATGHSTDGRFTSFFREINFWPWLSNKEMYRGVCVCVCVCVCACVCVCVCVCVCLERLWLCKLASAWLVCPRARFCLRMRYQILLPARTDPFY